MKQTGIWIGFCAWALVACGDAGGGTDAGPEPEAEPEVTVDEEALIDAVANYQQAGFVKINDLPYTSQHGLADLVNVYVSTADATKYRSVDPADTDQSIEPFGPGATIIKEHLDDLGEFDGLLVMYKAEAGYNPDVGDWWWGRFTGAPAADTLADSGKVGFCISCHSETNDFADTDYVGGVERSNLDAPGF